MLDTKRSVAAAVAGQIIVVAATFLVYGVSELGAELATRNTARFAAIFFALALAMRLGTAERHSTMAGFVAAHAMHFASVAYYSVISANAPLHQLSVRSAVSVIAGSTLLGTLTLTISAQRSWQKRLNTIAVFIFGFVFTFSTIFNGLGLRRAPQWGSVVPLPFLLAAMFWRLRSRPEPQSARAASAS
jgi:hypothetical protein